MSNGLIHTITKPTHITHTSVTLIDHIYGSSNTNSKIHSTMLCYDISDHMPSMVCTGTSKPNINKGKPLEVRRRKFTEANINDISNKIKNTNWQYLNTLETNHAYEHFMNKLNAIIDEEAHEVFVRIKPPHVIHQPWMTRGLIKSSYTLNEMYRKKLGKDKNHNYYINYAKYRNLFNNLKNCKTISFTVSC